MPVVEYKPPDELEYHITFGAPAPRLMLQDVSTPIMAVIGTFVVPEDRFVNQHHVTIRTRQIYVVGAERAARTMKVDINVRPEHVVSWVAINRPKATP